MNRAIIFQIFALFFFLASGALFYLNYYQEQENPSLLSAIGPFIMGIAMILLSRSKAIRGEG